MGDRQVRLGASDGARRPRPVAADLLRRLDQRVLPPLGRILHRLGLGTRRLRPLVIVAFACIAAVLAAAVWAIDREPRRGDPPVGTVVRVGVVEGQSIPAYVRSSQGELAALLASAAPGPTPTETYALVTLTAYLAPDRLTPVFGGVPVAQVYARVPLPETQTEIVRIPAYRVPADVMAGMAAVAQRKDGEAAEYRRLAAQLTGDGDRDRSLRGTYTSGAQVAAAEATAYRQHCSCVYAAVVRATPAALERIAARPEVRAVDPAPEVQRLDRAVFLPPLPEQHDVAKPPFDGGGPSSSPDPGSNGPAPASSGVAESPAPASDPPASAVPSSHPSTPPHS